MNEELVLSSICRGGLLPSRVGVYYQTLRKNLLGMTTVPPKIRNIELITRADTRSAPTK